MSQKNNTHCVDTWSRTCSNTMKFSHKWMIDNFSFHCLNLGGYRIHSSRFSPEDNDTLKFYLTMFPCGYSNGENDLLVYLHCLAEDMSPLIVKYKFYLVDINNMKKHEIEAHDTFSAENPIKLLTCVKKDSLLQNANELLPNDTLTIFCEVVVFNDIITILGDNAIQVKTSSSQMMDDIGLLLETHTLSDVTLTVSGKDIQAHKTILAARSPVFLAMFKHNMKESQTSCVVINDIEHEVFVEMLRFIYTDTAPNVDEIAMKLLPVVDQYGIEGLKTLCAEALYKSLNVDNALDILVLSDLHNVDELKQLVTNFICGCMRDVTHTTKFKSVAHRYPDLMIDIFHAITTRASGLIPSPAEEKVSELSQ